MLLVWQKPELCPGLCHWPGKICFVWLSNLQFMTFPVLGCQLFWINAVCRYSAGGLTWLRLSLSTNTLLSATPPVLQPPVFWCMVKGGKSLRTVSLQCSGKEWLGIPETVTALIILVAGIVPSGWHAYIRSRKILLVCYTAELFRSSCFPCKKLREDAKQGRNIKGPFPWTPHVGCSSCFMIPPFPQENSESRNLV